MAVPKSINVYEIMKNIPKGKLITISEIRKYLEASELKVMLKSISYITESRIPEYLN